MPKRGAMRNYAEYAAVRAVAFAVNMLPFSWAVGLGSAAGRLGYAVMRKRRELGVRQAMERLEVDEPAARRLVRENFRHYGKIAVELCRLADISSEEYDRRTDYAGIMELSLKLLEEKKGLIFITGHHGNWEWLNACPAAKGKGGGSIARPLDNPLLDGWLRKIRERGGMRVIDKAGALRGTLKVLKNNGIMGILIDQDAGSRGLMSPFLGKPASTETLPVQLAARLGTPIIVAAAVRKPGSASAFSIRFFPEAIRARPDADPAQEAVRLTNQLNDRLGALVRETPEQWFWIHRRWKTQPPPA